MLASIIVFAAEGTGPNPIAPENKELFWGAGSFLVFLLAMRLYLVPKVKQGMEVRYGSIREGHESAQSMRAAAQADVAAYEAALAEVRAEVAARLDAVRQTVDTERQAKLGEVGARLAATRAETDRALAASRAAARGDVAAAVGSVTARATQLVLGKSADGAVVKQAVEASMNGGRQ